MNRITHRLASLLMILAATVSYVATEGTGIVPAKYHPAVLLASLVLVGLSKSVQEVVKGE
jgi:hypothetical protein